MNNPNPPLTPAQLAGIRERVAETAKNYLLAGGQPSPAARDREDLLAEVERLNGVVQLLGSELQRDSMQVIDQLKHEPCLPIEHVERFLKRERDQHGKTSYWWRSLDEALDALRLHVSTGTPLTSPRPQEGPEALGVGEEPRTEAEELREEVERLRAETVRLTEERDLAVAHDRQPYPTQWAYDQACTALEKHRQRADTAAAKWEAVESIIRRAADHGSPSVDVDDLLEATHNAVQQHAENLADQTRLRSLTARPGSLTVDLEPPHELAVAMVEQAKQILGDAPNYTETPLTLTVKAAGEVERYAFTVQRVGKLTPHEAREQAEAERDRLRHALERATLSVEHDRASRTCQERNMPIHDEDCPACEVQAALQPAGEADRA